MPKKAKEIKYEPSIQPAVDAVADFEAMVNNMAEHSDAMQASHDAFIQAMQNAGASADALAELRNEFQREYHLHLERQARYLSDLCKLKYGLADANRKARKERLSEARRAKKTTTAPMGAESDE